MISVAIVEDERKAADQLRECLNRFETEHDEHFESTHYTDGEQFLSDFRSQFDIGFMDIEMPGLNGMRVAQKLRDIDQTVALVFITNLSRYAINGYEVGAMDYILKPLEYNAFLLKIRKVVNYCHRLGNKCLKLSTTTGMVRLSVNDLLYVEISRHDIIYHTAHGMLSGYGTMKQVEQALGEFGFYRCNSCYLVNMRYVKRIQDYMVIVGDHELSISHPRKKDFLRALDEYYR